MPAMSSTAQTETPNGERSIHNFETGVRPPRLAASLEVAYQTSGIAAYRGWVTSACPAAQKRETDDVQRKRQGSVLASSHLKLVSTSFQAASGFSGTWAGRSELARATNSRMISDQAHLLFSDAIGGRSLPAPRGYVRI